MAWARSSTSTDSDPVGTFVLDPGAGASPVGVKTTFTLTWTHPVRWRALRDVDLRLDDGTERPLWVRFTEGISSTGTISSTLGVISLLDPSGNVVGSGLAGENRVLEGAMARLHLRESTVAGTGADGPSVTARFVISFLPGTPPASYAVELFASDDAGTRQGPEQAGSWDILSRLFLPLVRR